MITNVEIIHYYIVRDDEGNSYFRRYSGDWERIIHNHDDDEDKFQRVDESNEIRLEKDFITYLKTMETMKEKLK